MPEVDPIISTPPPITDIPIITPPKIPNKFNRKLLIIPLAGFGILLILAIIVSVAKSINRRNIIVSPPPVTSTSPVVLPTQTPPQIPITPIPPRLPLTELSGYQLLTTSDRKIWLTEFTSVGPRKSLFLDLGQNIVDLSLSPNGQLLAFTYSDSSQSESYPKTGLKVMNIITKEVTEFIPLASTSVRRPTWSSDSIYLAVWNNGKSVVLFDMTNKSRPLQIDSSSIGQIVFVPGAAKFSYVDNSNLIESEYTGVAKTKLLGGVNALRGLKAGEILPDLHYYTPDNRYLIFHNSLGQLVLYNRADASQQILAEGNPAGSQSGYYSFGEVIGIDAQRLVYYNLGKQVYVAGPDDNPLYIFNFINKIGQPFFSNRKEAITLDGFYPDPTGQKILFADQGFRVFSYDGRMLSRCENTALKNDNTYAPGRLWTPDGKYFLSRKTFQIVNTNNCAITSTVESTIPETAIWIK